MTKKRQQEYEHETFVSWVDFIWQ